METKEYKLLDGRTIRAKYDRLGMCKISQENLESFVKEFDTSYRQAKILEKIKENYALMKLEERKVGKWIRVDHTKVKCSNCDITHLIAQYPHGVIDYCPNCGSYNQSIIEEER